MTSFVVESTCGDARCGVLRVRGGDLELPTPALLGLTRRGAPLNMTQDVHATLPDGARLLGVNPLAFFADAPPAEAVCAAGGAGSFLGLARCALVASTRDPLAYDGGGGARSAGSSGAATNDVGLAVTTQAGVRRLSPPAYAALLCQLRCDVSIGLVDEAAAGEPVKRLRGAAERTARWHRDTATSLAARGAAGAAVLDSFWAAVGGGSDADERRRAGGAAAAQVPQPAGYSLAGFGTGESPEARPALLAAALEQLPRGAPRHVAGLSSPTELLEAVAGGADLCDGDYAHTATQAGCALIFPVGPGDAVAAAGDETAAPSDGTGAGGDGFRACLRALVYAMDCGPLLPGCTCFTCRRHSRGYLHHLLAAHEMLAEVLLDVHNTHHMLRFMAALRAAVAANDLDGFAAWHAERVEAVRLAAAEAAAALLPGEEDCIYSQ
jgi:queuine tRNA-ribosyltransferase subunit QTRTD1